MRARAPARTGRPPRLGNLQPHHRAPHAAPATAAARTRAAKPLSPSEAIARLTARGWPSSVIAPAPARARSSSAAVRWARLASGSQRAAGSGSPPGSICTRSGHSRCTSCPACGCAPGLDQRGAPGPPGPRCSRRRQPPSPRRARGGAGLAGGLHGEGAPWPRRVRARGRPVPSARPGRRGAHRLDRHRRPPPPVCRRPAAPPAARRTARARSPRPRRPRAGRSRSPNR